MLHLSKRIRIIFFFNLRTLLYTKKKLSSIFISFQHEINIFLILNLSLSEIEQITENFPLACKAVWLSKDPAPRCNIITVSTNGILYRIHKLTTQNTICSLTIKLCCRTKNVKEKISSFYSCSIFSFNSIFRYCFRKKDIYVLQMHYVSYENNNKNVLFQNIFKISNTFWNLCLNDSCSYNFISLTWDLGWKYAIDIQRGLLNFLKFVGNKGLVRVIMNWI